MDNAIRLYLRRARANLNEFGRRVVQESSPSARELFQDLLTEYAGALMMLQLAIKENLDAAALQGVRPGEVEFIAIVTPAGIFDYVSCAVSALGYKADQLLGMNAFDFIHAEDLEHVYNRFREGIEHPEVPVDVSFRFRSPEGDWVWLQVRAQNLSYGTQVDGYVARCRIAPAMRNAV